MTRIAILHGGSDLYGASRVLIQDVGLLVSCGHDVDVVLPMNGPLVDALRAAGANPIVDPALRVVRRVDGLRAMRPPRRLPPVCKSADVTVLWTLALMLYAPLLALRRRSFGVSVHELLPGPLGAALLRVTTTGAAWVHANSETVRRWVERHDGGRKALLAYPSVRIPPTITKSHRIEGPLRLMLAGRVNGWKGHMEAIEAGRLLRARGCELTLDLYGKPFPGQEDHLAAVLREVRLEDWIQYRGEYEANEPPYAEYDLALCLPRVPEPFGLVPLEAWAHGTRSLGVPRGGAIESLLLVEGITVGETASDVARGVEWYSARRSDLAKVNPNAPAARYCTDDRRKEIWARSLPA